VLFRSRSCDSQGHCWFG